MHVGICRIGKFQNLNVLDVQRDEVAGCRDALVGSGTFIPANGVQAGCVALNDLGFEESLQKDGFYGFGIRISGSNRDSKVS